jgi:carbonic anhydrase
MIRQRLAVSRILAIAAIVLAGCASRERSHPVHWSYLGSTGPAHWGSLSPEYALCSTGRSQSPIDIADTKPLDLSNIVFHYRPTPLSIINNGHTVQVICAPGSSIEIEDESFELMQFHFHLPSEHSVNGAHAEAEMHLVHRSADGRLAVVGVMLREGATNPMYDVIATNLPKSGQKIERPDLLVDVAALLPTVQRTYRYDGSLTTPPGTEGVKWCLMVQPVTLCSSQIAAFRKHYSGNNRPVQNLNGRIVIEDVTP